MELREYQKKLIDDIRQSISKGNKAIVSVLGCGGGKSIIQGAIAASANKKGNRALFLVHRRELCEQIRETFIGCGIDTELTDICMVQTVSRHLDNIKEPKIIITDEAHHSTANTYKRVYDYFPNALLLGFTATPCRLNQGGLGEVYSDLITSVSTKWLIDNHFLAPYKYYSMPMINRKELRIRSGEYIVSGLLENKHIYGETVKQYEKLAKGKKAIAYCSSVKAAKETAEQFQEAGYPVAELDGTTNKEARKKIMQAFRDGIISILCNCDLFGEGLDVPDCECVILLRPTKSLNLYIQQSMRSMRYLPGKTAIIIDHVGNCYEHGLPDDTREWTLEPKKKQEKTVKIRECKSCFAAFSPKLERCPYCGAEVIHEVRTENRKTIDVDLVEMKRQEKIKNTRLSEAELKTWDEVREFQKLKKYKFGFCIHYCQRNNIPIPIKYKYMIDNYYN